MRKNDLEYNFRKSFCLDEPSKLNLKGGWDGENRDVLWVSIFRCENKDYCKSKEEIDQFIDSHYIELIYNQQTYIPTIYNEKEKVVQNRVATKKFMINSAIGGTDILSIQK